MIPESASKELKCLIVKHDIRFPLSAVLFLFMYHRSAMCLTKASEASGWFWLMGSDQWANAAARVGSAQAGSSAARVYYVVRPETPDNLRQLHR